MIQRCTMGPEEKQKLTQRACTLGKGELLSGPIIISKIHSSLEKDL